MRSIFVLSLLLFTSNTFSQDQSDNIFYLGLGGSQLDLGSDSEFALSFNLGANIYNSERTQLSIQYTRIKSVDITGPLLELAGLEPVEIELKGMDSLNAIWRGGSTIYFIGSFGISKADVKNFSTSSESTSGVGIGYKLWNNSRIEYSRHRYDVASGTAKTSSWTLMFPF